MDKDAEKRYRELPPKEKYDSAIRAGEEPYNPLQTVKDLIKEKEDKQKNTPMGALSQGARMGPALPKGEDESKKEPAKPVKKMAKGGSVSSASKRADGCAVKGKTRGKIV